MHERILAWTPELYPKVTCHKGFDRQPGDGGGEHLLRGLATRVCDESDVGCYKRCIFEYLGVLQETSLLTEGKDDYGKILFEAEEWIAENLAFLLFTNENNETAKMIAKKVITDCDAPMKKINKLPNPPTCLEQNELHLCIEKAITCPEIQLEKATLITKVCSRENLDFNYNADNLDSNLRPYNESYPDVSCHQYYGQDVLEAIKVLSRFCARSLRGCYKRCIFEQLGVLEYIMQPKHHLYTITFRKEEDIADSIQFYLFPSESNDYGAKIASQIINDCDNLMQIFKDMMAPPSCKEENELYMCIEKAMSCPGVPLQKGTLVTKVCSLELLDYFQQLEADDNEHSE
ncbi:unnamed protein product [Orchesella dallaii]|uniref:Odorant-binding protein n=1 Tax=Orchesella dallaii TaxID=48710 RepID=A0ABP1RN11_9HEXA